MTSLMQSHTALAEWIARAAVPFSLDDPESFQAAVDAVMAALGDEVKLLGFGEALHGGEELLILRNRLFQRLVERHGYRAIALESSFPRGRLIDEYVAGRGPGSYDEVQEAGFSHGFGKLDANRELMEWMRQYNSEASDPAQDVKLRFYGFDHPTESWYSDSPRQVLHFVLAYFAELDPAGAQAHRQRIENLLGEDAAWENPAVMMDPAQSIGLSPAATALRIATEDLVTALQVRRPELVARSDEPRFAEALHYATVARMLLNYHAVAAGTSPHRIAEMLGIRDAAMAENLAYIVRRSPGKVLAFAHNGHVRRGTMQWQLGEDLQIWWPAGAHLAAMFGPHYAVIGTDVGESEANGIGQPEAGTLAARFMAAPGPGRFIPTHQGAGLPMAEIAALPTRTGSTLNPSYFPLDPQRLADFDWLAVLDEATYNRGGPPLQEWAGASSGS